MGYEYSEPPINKNGKYYLDWKEVTINNETWNGYCPYYFEDQTVEEYDMDINVVPKIVIDKIQAYYNSDVIASNNVNSNWKFYGNVSSDYHTINVTNNNEILVISKYYYDYSSNNYQIRYYWNINGSTVSIPDNSWVYNYNIASTTWDYIKFFSNNQIIFTIGDSKTGDNQYSKIIFNGRYVDFSGISWMTFE